MPWYDLPMFTRIMFIIGFLTSVGVLSALAYVAGGWVNSKLSHNKAAQKSRAAEPVDLQGLEFTAYSKQQWEDFRRELSEKGGAKGEVDRRTGTEI